MYVKGFDFQMDLSQLEPHSLFKDKIMLPYRGPLPDAVSGNEAVLYINVQPTQKVKCVLYADRPYVVDWERDELIDLLDRFFAEECSVGLSPYWHGVWHANYISWRRAAKCPECLRYTLSIAGPEAVEGLIDHISHARQ